MQFVIYKKRKRWINVCNFKGPKSCYFEAFNIWDQQLYNKMITVASYSINLLWNITSSEIYPWGFLGPGSKMLSFTVILPRLCFKTFSLLRIRLRTGWIFYMSQGLFAVLPGCVVPECISSAISSQKQLKKWLTHISMCYGLLSFV